MVAVEAEHQHDSTSDEGAEKREAGQLYTVAKAVLKPTFKFLWRISVEGLEHVPTDGGAIMAPNHVSVLDSFFLPTALPRRITYVGKAEYMDSWKTKHLFPAMGMIPIDRSGGNKSEGALSAACRVLRRGELFGIYPEGTRSRDGVLHKGHTGVARLALRAGVPIVPVGLQGTVEVQPPDAKFPKVFRHVKIRIGRPIDVSRYQDRAADHLVLRQITDEVMYEIRNLSGQDYVDQYATKQAETMPAETARIHVGVEGDTVPTTGHGNGNGDAAPEPAARRRSSADVLRSAPMPG
jgi:1-acyl-sn-glycerol-3-phosphate acyltransferase